MHGAESLGSASGAGCAPGRSFDSRLVEEREVPAVRKPLLLLCEELELLILPGVVERHVWGTLRAGRQGVA